MLAKYCPTTVKCMYGQIDRSIGRKRHTYVRTYIIHTYIHAYIGTYQPLTADNVPAMNRY